MGERLDLEAQHTRLLGVAKRIYDEFSKSFNGLTTACNGILRPFPLFLHVATSFHARQTAKVN